MNEQEMLKRLYATSGKASEKSKKVIPDNKITEERDKEFNVIIKKLLESKCKKDESGKISNPIKCRECDEGQEFDDILDKIDRFIFNHKRIPYPIITLMIFNSSGEIYENLYHTIDGLIEYASTNEKVKDETINELLRLRDHVELANAQSTVIDREEEAVENKIKNDINKLNKKIKEANKHFKKVENKTKELSKELIGIVAIFVGIAFVMFGGTNLINGLFSEINPQKLMLLLCIGSLFGVVIIETIYYFIMMVFDLSGLHQESGESGKTFAQKAEKYLFITLIITGCLNFLGINNIGW